MPEILDYLLVAVVALFLPIHGYIKTGSLHKQLAEDPSTLAGFYYQTILTLWLIAGAVIALWLWLERPIIDIGLVHAPTTALLAAWAVVVAISLGLFWQAYRAGSSTEAAQSIMRQLDGETGVDAVMPKTPQQYRLFQMVSLTAGVTEEIIYRGYLIWFFTAYMPMPAAAAASLVVFIAGHLYQRSFKALVQVAGLGLALTLVYVMSGSIFPAILLHAVIDLSSNATIWRARHAAA